MSSTVQQQTVTTKYQDFNENDINITKFEENDRSKGQNIAFVRYKNDSNLMLQLPKIKLESYGIPQKGEYYKDDMSRSFIKLPLNKNNQEVSDFSEKIISLDAKMSSPDMKKHLFGAKAAKYKYVPIYREPQEEEEEESDKKKSKYPRPAYMKVKLDTTWPEGEIKTQIYVSTLKDGKREREKKDVTTITDVSEIIRYLSTVRLIIRPVKAWCEKKAKMGSDTMQYGIIFKAVKIEVEPSEGGSNDLIQYMSNDAFIDSDDEEAPKFQGAPSSAPIKTIPLPLKKTNIQDEEDEEDNEDEDNEEDEEDNEEEEEEEVIPEPIPEPPKKARGPAKKNK